MNLIYLIFGFIDLIFIYFSFFEPYYSAIDFFVLHLLLFVIFYLLYINRKKIISFLPLFFPFIGFIFLFLLEYLSIKPASKDIIDDYEKYIRFKSQSGGIEDVNIQQELNTMAFLDKLDSVPDYKKRDVMIEFLVKNIDIKVSLLKLALEDSNPEVVHYASSTLNMLEKQFEGLIDEYKGLYSYKKDKESLEKLENIYYEYINSDILEKEVQKTYRDEHVEILKKILFDYGDDYKTQIKLAENYIELDKISSARKLLDKLKKQYGDRFKIYKLLLKIHYLEGDISEIMDLAKYIKESKIKIPEKEKSIINFWEVDK